MTVFQTVSHAPTPDPVGQIWYPAITNGKMEMINPKKTFLELIGAIGEKNIAIAEMYGNGLLTDVDLLVLVPKPVAEEIQHFFIMEKKIS